MNTLDQQLQSLFRQAVRHFLANREMLRDLIHGLGLHHPFVRQAYRSMPPVAQCQELALQARAHAASLMPPDAARPIGEGART